MIGVDRGIPATLALSDGRLFRLPVMRAKERRRLGALQRQKARQGKGSENRRETNRRIAALHQTVKDRRRNWIEQQTTRLIREHDVRREPAGAEHGPPPQARPRPRTAKSVPAERRWGEGWAEPQHPPAGVEPVAPPTSREGRRLRVHEAVTFLLENLPPQVTLAMTTRADPPLPLSRLRARGELVEVRAADLRFTTEEAEVFLNEMIGAALVAALEARTEGWAAGLQLAGLSARTHAGAADGSGDVAGFVQAFSGSHRFVLDYLVEEVLSRKPDEVRAFMLDTSGARPADRRALRRPDWPL